MKIRYSAKTDVGLKREVNQDSYKLGEQSFGETKGYLFVVCDGMGGHSSGEIASKIGVDTIVDSFYTSDEKERRTVLEHAFYEANRNIFQEGDGTMGTTGVAALFFKDMLYIANVGDSRAYLIREDYINQISRDHSLVAEQVAAGLLTSEQARQSNYRNMITRALGYRAEVQMDIFDLRVHRGDIVVLSSDGLHGLVEDDEIKQVVTTQSPDEAIQQLITMANDRGGTDNITVAIGVVDDIDGILGDEPDEPMVPTTTLGTDSSPSPQQDASTIRLPETPSAQDSSPDPPQKSSSRGLPKGIIGGVLAVVALIGVVGAFMLFGSGSGNDDDTTPSPSNGTLTTTGTITATATITATPTITATVMMPPSPTAVPVQPTTSTPPPIDNSFQSQGEDAAQPDGDNAQPDGDNAQPDGDNAQPDGDGENDAQQPTQPNNISTSIPTMTAPVLPVQPGQPAQPGQPERPVVPPERPVVPPERPAAPEQPEQPSFPNNNTQPVQPNVPDALSPTQIQVPEQPLLTVTIP